MLVLSRRAGEKIVIGDRITITIQRISGGRVNVGIDAPDDVHIVRGELKPLVDAFRHSLDDDVHGMAHEPQPGDTIRATLTDTLPARKTASSIR